MDQIKKVSQTGMCHVHPAEKVGKYYPYFGVTGFKDDVETLPTLTGSTEEVLMVEFTVRDKSRYICAAVLLSSLSLLQHTHTYTYIHTHTHTHIHTYLNLDAILLLLYIL